ncbi:MAG: sigma-70 family RNA polymerase sigma factor [Christensenellaceae bacterium]
MTQTEMDNMAASADKLWEKYFDDPSVENKNELLLHYMYLVRKVVLRMMPVYQSKNDYDDLLSSGVIGLMDAINKFDQFRNVKFETYAYKRIRGEILDFMRKQDWISSSMRQRIKKVTGEIEAAVMRTGREPEDADVAKALGLTEQQVKEARDNAYIYNIMYFENVIASNSKDESVKLIDTVQDDNEQAMPESSLEKKEMLEMLTQALSGLPENERMVLQLYYKDELLLREIAQILEVSESRVSQIHSKALKRIRTQLGRQMKED